MNFNSPLYSGAIHPQNNMAGVYTGSGIAQGGQQGRLAITANGVGGVSQGGPTARASQTLVPGRGPGSPSTPKPAHPVIPINSKMPPSGVTHTPNAGPGTPPPTPIPTPVDPFAQYYDSTYYTDLLGQQHNLDTQLNPVLSELNAIQSQDVNGKTLYDRLYSQAQGSFMDQLRASRSGLAQHGLLHSGAANHDYASRATSWFNSQQDLSNQYGTGRSGALNQQQLQLQQQFDSAKQLLDQAAEQRANERALGQYNLIYGATVPQPTTGASS